MLAVATQFAIFPLFDLTVSVADNLLIGGIFTVLSLARSYLLRRLFEAAADGSSGLRPLHSLFTNNRQRDRSFQELE